MYYLTAYYLTAFTPGGGSLAPVDTDRNPLSYDRIDIKGHLEKLQVLLAAHSPSPRAPPGRPVFV